MGYLKEKHGMELVGRTPEGSCPECAAMHEPTQPHNLHSLTYQYKFYDQHGRFPTWEDAMAHCSESVKKFWITELEKRGIKAQKKGEEGCNEAEKRLEEMKGEHDAGRNHY